MKNTGFTLLETIIYCALFSILMSGALVALNALISSNISITTKTSAITEAMFINQKLAWATNGATSIIKIDDQTIQLIRPDLVLDTPLTFSFLDEGIFLSRGTSSKKQLMGEQFKIKNIKIEVDSNEIKMTYSINNIPFIFYDNY